MLRFSILSILVSLFNVMVARAEPSFILVDHSATMAAEDKQSELNILLSYHSKKFRQTGYSVTYMGGENGGDCRGEVDIVEPRMEEDYQSFDPLFLADGNSPVLRSLHSIYSQIGDASTNIVIVTDGENVCGGVSALCQAARTFREDFPKVNLQFEPVFATFESRSFECLNQPVSHEEVRVADIHLPFNYHPITIAQQSKPKLTGWSWAFYFWFTGWLVVFAWWAYIGNKFIEVVNNFEKKEPSEDDTDSDASVTEKTKLRKLTEKVGVLFSKYGIWGLFVILLVSGFCSWLWGKEGFTLGRTAALANMDTKLGAAVFSSLIASFLGWVAFQFWSNGNKKLKSEFKKNFEQFKKDEDLRERESVKTSILVSFENYADTVSIPEPKTMSDKRSDEQEYWNAYSNFFEAMKSIKEKIKFIVDDAEINIETIRKNYVGLDFNGNTKAFFKNLSKTDVPSEYLEQLHALADDLAKKKKLMRMKEAALEKRQAREKRKKKSKPTRLSESESESKGNNDIK